MVLWFTLSSALAHGPALAPLRVASHDASGPVHVVLTEGVLYPDSGGWRFLCPTLWGGIPEAPIGRSWDATARIHGAFDLYRITPEGHVEAAGTPELSATSVLAVASGDDTTWALVRESAVDALWQVDPPVRLAALPHRALSITHHQSEVRVGMLTSEGQIVLTSHEGDSGETLETLSWEHEGGWTPSVRSDGQEAWVILRQSGEARLHRWGAQAMAPLATSSNDILGPVSAGMNTYLTIDGTLHTLTDELASPAPHTSSVQCLEQHGAYTYICTEGSLNFLLDEGSLSEPLVDMDRILPPDPDLVPEPLADPCEAEWLRALADLGRVPAGDTGLGNEEPPVAEPGGCGGNKAMILLPMLWLFGRRRAGYSEPSTPA